MQVKRQVSEFLVQHHRDIVEVAAAAWQQQSRTGSADIVITIQIPVVKHVPVRRKRRKTRPKQRTG